MQEKALEKVKETTGKLIEIQECGAKQQEVFRKFWIWFSDQSSIRYEQVVADEAVEQMKQVVLMKLKVQI